MDAYACKQSPSWSKLKKELFLDKETLLQQQVKWTHRPKVTFHSPP